MSDFLYYLFIQGPTTRKVIYSLTGQVLIIWMCEKTLQRRRSLLTLMICQIIKLLALYPMDYYLLQSPGMSTEAVSMLRVFTFFWNCLSFGLVPWIYEGNHGKAWLVLFAGELIFTLLSFPVLLCVGLIEKRPDVIEMGGSLLPGDFLIPVLVWLIWKIVWKLLRIPAERFGKWIPRYQWILWISMFLIFFSNSILMQDKKFDAGCKPLSSKL